MLTNVSHKIVRLFKPSERLIAAANLIDNRSSYNRIIHRYIHDDKATNPNDQDPRTNTETSQLTKYSAKEIFEKEFPDYFDDGKFITRISYVDFIDQALDKLNELGLERDLNAYKELLKVFPPGRYHPASSWDIGLHHAPQQLCAIRLLTQMENNLVRPDKETEALVLKAFSENSDVWKKIARANYWTMKGRNIDPYPLPEKLPKKPEQLAKFALARMTNDHKSVISITSTHSLPDVVDNTWIVYSQSPIQKSIIDRLDEETILYIEETGQTFVGQNYLSYFTLKLYDDEETCKLKRKKKDKDYNYNTLKVQFYGKPIKEKTKELEEAHHVDNYYILAVGMTGTSSQDSVLSWLKIMQKRVPKLGKMNVVFRFSRSTNEIQPIDEEGRANVG